MPAYPGRILIVLGVILIVAGKKKKAGSFLILPLFSCRDE